MGQYIFHCLLYLFVKFVGINNEISTQLSKNIRQRALLSPDVTFLSPDDKDDDGGALTRTGRHPGYQAADGVAIIVETGVPTHRPWRYLMVHLGLSPSS